MKLHMYMCQPGRKVLLAAALLVPAFSSFACAVQAQPKPSPDKQADNASFARSTTTTVMQTGVLTRVSRLDVSKPYGSHLTPILERINANTDQREKITQIVMSYKSKIQPLRDQYKQKQQEFLSSMVAGGAAETIMSKQLELVHISGEITSNYTLMRLQVRKLLTPQQILQFEGYAREHGWR